MLTFFFLVGATVDGKDVYVTNAKGTLVAYMARVKSRGNAFVTKAGVVYFAIKI